MLRIYPNEIFREVDLGYTLKFRYAISTRGRLISFTEKFETGRLLGGGMADGYKIMRFKVWVDGKKVDKHIFFFKMVAQAFLPKNSEEQKYVLHLDYVRDNDNVNNLKWATHQEMVDHTNKSPRVIENRKKLLEHNIKSDGKKLTVTRVMHLKKLLKDPNRKTRIKMLAKQFGVSEVQVRKIEKGQVWGHIKS